MALVNSQYTLLRRSTLPRHGRNDIRGERQVFISRHYLRHGIRLLLPLHSDADVR